MFSIGKRSDLDENWSQRTKESKRDSGLRNNQRNDTDASSTNTIDDMTSVFVKDALAVLYRLEMLNKSMSDFVFYNPL